jgi:mRNA interferase MazF
MQRGDIVLVNLPQATGIGGHEQAGTRPALVVHDNSTSESLSLIMIIPLTSNLTTNKFVHTILVQPSEQNGLSVVSVLLVFQLRAADKRRIVKKIGVLETAIMTQVDIELRKLLGI